MSPTGCRCRLPTHQAPPGPLSRPQVYLATATHIERGEFYSDCNISDSSPQSLDANLGRKLWEKSEELVAPFL